MIVISGALVLVALVLLIIGLISTSLGFVYASIAVSVVAFAFLLVGILQRRGEQVPETASGAVPTAPRTPVPAGSDVEGVTAILPNSRADAPAAAEVPLAAATPGRDVGGAVDDSVSGSVLVVPGRPRYHVGGCRYLTGKDPDEVDVQTARTDGYTACGVCKPDAALAEAAEAPAEQLPPAAAIVAAEEADETAPEPVTSARRATRATATTGRAPAKKAAAKAAAKAPAKAPAKAAKKAPAKVALTKTGGDAAKPGSVVVIPDRDKFHKADCRFVRDAADTKEMTRAAASRQGYVACGVCKP